MTTRVHFWGPSQGLDGTGGGEGPDAETLPASPLPVAGATPSSRGPGTGPSQCPPPPPAPLQTDLTESPHLVGSARRGSHTARPRGGGWSEASPSALLLGGPLALPPTAGRGPASGPFQPHSDDTFGASSGLQGVGLSSAGLRHCAPRGGMPQPATAQPRNGPNGPRRSLG